MKAQAARIASGIGVAFIAAGSAYFGSLGAFAADGGVGSGDLVLSAIPAGATFFSMRMMRFGGYSKNTGVL